MMIGELEKFSKQMGDSIERLRYVAKLTFDDVNELMFQRTNAKSMYIAALEVQLLGWLGKGAVQD
jgi:hypothetical protein